MSTIYGLCDPRPGHNPAIRYVGQTVQSPYVRLAAHCSQAKNPARRKLPSSCWIGKMLDEGVRPIVVMLAYVHPDEQIEKLHEAEIFWIDHLRSRGFSLLNIAPGGEGRRGPVSDEGKRNMSIAGKGRVFTEAHRAAMSAAGKGRKHPPRTPEWRAAHSAKMMGHACSEETRAKMSAAQKGSVKPKLSEIAKKRPRSGNGKFL